MMKNNDFIHNDNHADENFTTTIDQHSAQTLKTKRCLCDLWSPLKLLGYMISCLSSKAYGASSKNLLHEAIG